MNKFFVLDSILTKILRPIIVTLGLTVAFMLAYAIFARTVMDSPVFGIEEIMLFCIMWFYMLGAVTASRQRAHLSADFVKVMSKNPVVHQLARIISSIISLVIAIMVVQWCYDLFAWGVDKGQKTPVFGLPQVLSQASLFVASIFFIVYILRDLWCEVKGFPNEAQYFPRSDDIDK